MMTQWPVLIPAVEGDGWFCDFDAEGVPKRHPVREVPETAFKQFLDGRTTHTFESVYGPVSSKDRKLLAIAGRIASAASDRNRNLKRVAKIVWEMVPSEKPSLDDDLLPSQAKPRYRAAVDAIRSPLDPTGAVLNAGAGAFNTRAILWQRESLGDWQLMPALLCSSAAQALYLHALFAVSKGWGLKICRHCKTLFSSPDDRKCCTRRCAMAENSKHYRERMK